MPTLDWSQCPGVESIPGKLSGAWVFRNSRMPVKLVFENLEDGMSIDGNRRTVRRYARAGEGRDRFCGRSLDTVNLSSAGRPRGSTFDVTKANRTP